MSEQHRQLKLDLVQLLDKNPMNLASIRQVISKESKEINQALYALRHEGKIKRTVTDPPVWSVIPSVNKIKQLWTTEPSDVSLQQKVDLKSQTKHADSAAKHDVTVEDVKDIKDVKDVKENKASLLLYPEEAYRLTYDLDQKLAKLPEDYAMTAKQCKQLKMAFDLVSGFKLRFSTSVKFRDFLSFLLDHPVAWPTWSQDQKVSNFVKTQCHWTVDQLGKEIFFWRSLLECFST
jgi:hypothetical protein